MHSNMEDLERVKELSAVGFDIAEQIAHNLDEFQRYTEISQEEQVGLVDVFVGGSFIDPTVEQPADFDIVAVTDSPPAEGVKDGFWRMINEKELQLSSFGHSDDGLQIDCCETTGVTNLTQETNSMNQFSLRFSGSVSTQMYAEIARSVKQGGVNL